MLPRTPGFTNPAAERQLLAAMLNHPEACIGDCVEHISQNHFSDQSHRQIFEVMVDLWNKKVPFDSQKVERALCQPGAGDGFEIRNLLGNLVCTQVNLDELENVINELKEKYFLREINKITRQISELSMGPDTPRLRIDLIDALHNLVPELACHLRPQPNTIKEQMMEAMDDLERRYESNQAGRKKKVRFPTGIKPIDAILHGGLIPGELMVVSGGPSCGKTALAISCALRNAVERNCPTVYFSLDLSAIELVRRFIAVGANQKHLNLLKGRISEADFPLLIEHASKLANSRISLAETPGIALVELWGMLQDQKPRFGTRVVFIDTINLLGGGQKPGIEAKLKRLKEMAVEFQVAVIALCNIPKEVADSLDSEEINFEGPIFSSLSGNCDLFAFLSRPRPAKTGIERLNLSLCHGRNGFIGQASLNFNASTGRIASLNVPLHTRFEPRGL